MPLKTSNPIMHIEPASLTSLDTDNVMSFHGLWSVFSRCADTMENGKRYENMSWRLFSREANVCSNSRNTRSLPSRHANSKHDSSSRIPALSSSVDSNSSVGSAMDLTTHSCPLSARPEIRRIDSQHKQKHISPLDLEKIVTSISEKTVLEPLSPLPPSLAIPRDVQPSPPTVQVEPSTPAPRGDETEAESTSAALDPIASPQITHIVPDSSSSTVATVANSEFSEMSPPPGTTCDSSTSTEMSTSSIVRGFSKDCISSYSHSRTNLAPTPTQSILKASPLPHRSAKRSRPTFIVGGSSGENDDSSFEAHFDPRSSSLSEGLRRSAPKKTSFKDEVLTRTIQDKTYESEGVFEDSDEEDEDEDESESAIEDDEDVDDDWEDEEESSSPPERELFQRVDSRPNLTSRRSLLTTMMHEGDRATALQNAASKSTSAIRRSRTTSPNGPMGTSPPTQHHNLPSAFQQQNRSRPIALPTSTSALAIPQAHSPRTTRRNMLQTELTESLRKHLLWERQVKGSTTNAHLRRRHTSNDVKNLKAYPGPSTAEQRQPGRRMDGMTGPGSWNQNNQQREQQGRQNYFESGLQEYHQKGW